MAQLMAMSGNDTPDLIDVAIEEDFKKPKLAPSPTKFKPPVMHTSKRMPGKRHGGNQRQKRKWAAQVRG